jgi:hypothetical protein
LFFCPEHNGYNQWQSCRRLLLALHKWLVLRLTLKSNRDVLISVLEVLLCLSIVFWAYAFSPK